MQMLGFMSTEMLDCYNLSEILVKRWSFFDEKGKGDCSTHKFYGKHTKSFRIFA